MSFKTELSVLASGAVQTQILCARDFSAIAQPTVTKRDCFKVLSFRQSELW
jgi:hypothetical protein